MSSGAGPANLLFPSGIDQFSTKVDRNIVISGEGHVIPLTPAYTLFLDYVPLQENPSSVSIPGYTEVSGTPSTFQFNVVYSGVSAGELTFNQFQSGLSITASYVTYGDVVSAEFINSLQSGLVAVESYVLANVASGSFVATSGGTMTGPLLMNSDIQLGTGSITSVVSGTNDIGANGTPLGTLYADEIQTNYLHSASPLLIEAVDDILTLSGTSILAEGSVIPNPSGTLDLGSVSSAWRRIYVDELSKSVNLSSGANIIVLVSGSNSIGSASDPLGTIYADNIVSSSITNGLSGTFVHITGDTMTGDLVIATGNQINTYIVNNTLGDLTLTASTLVQLGVDMVPTYSGLQNLGSAAIPFDTIYVKNIDGGTISGNFVLKTGDTMTGNLNLPVGTELNVYSIVSSDPSGTVNISASQLNVNTTSNVNFSQNSNQVFEIGLAAIYHSTSIIPTASGAYTLGTPGRPLQAVYADNFYYLKNISGASFLNPTFNGSITLASGASLVPEFSGTVNLGASGLSFGTLYVNSIITPSTSGTYVNKFGDTMFGNLTMSSDTNLLTISSGTNTVGTAAVPFAAIYADNIENGFVHVTGDTMTGPLGLQTIYGTSGTLSISGNTLDLQGQQVNMTSNVGPIILDANTELQLLQNGNPGFVISSSGNYTYADILPSASGAWNIGTPSLPYGTIYADTVITNGSSGTFVSKFGDIMTGNLTMKSANVLTFTSGTGTIGADGVPFSAMYTDNLYVGGLPVNPSGDLTRPNPSTDFGVASWSGTTGAGLRDSSVIISNNGLTLNSNIISGTTISGSSVYTTNLIGAGNATGCSIFFQNVFGATATVQSTKILVLGLGMPTPNVLSNTMSGNAFLGGNLVPGVSGMNYVGTVSMPFSGMNAFNISGNTIKAITTLITPSTPPASGSAVGTTGQIIMGTDGFLYGCSGTNLWGRVQLSSF